jgi:hypothetical protein
MAVLPLGQMRHKQQILYIPLIRFCVNQGQIAVQPIAVPVAAVIHAIYVITSLQKIPDTLQIFLCGLCEAMRDYNRPPGAIRKIANTVKLPAAFPFRPQDRLSLSQVGFHNLFHFCLIRLFF